MYVRMYIRVIETATTRLSMWRNSSSRLVRNFLLGKPISILTSREIKLKLNESQLPKFCQVNQRTKIQLENSEKITFGRLN